jgi:glycosyltransferase involved in cell wall biosynthesis
MKAALCVPTIVKPYKVLLDSIEAALPVLEKDGIEHCMVSEIGCPYISAARAAMLRKSLDAKADVIVFLDHDISFGPEALSKLILTEGDYVVGTYRFKKDVEEYMGQLIAKPDGTPIVREDGCLNTFSAPAGFMKITPNTVNRVIEKFPELCYGDRHSPHLDFFNHGAYNHVWYGEDYAACRRWLELGEIWTIPNLFIHHHSGDKVYEGNFHEFLLKQPGGSHADLPN